MIAALVAAHLVGLSAGCKFATFVPDPTLLSTNLKCFDWKGADANDPSLEAIYNLKQRIASNFTASSDHLRISVTNWESAQMVSIISHIILKEIMGYETELDHVAGSSSLYECVADGTHIFNLETWINTKQNQRTRWAEQITETPIGYYGREGLFLSEVKTAQRTLGAICLNPFLLNWEAFKFDEVLSLLPSDKSTTMSKPYLCTNQTHERCFEGRYVPPQCCDPAGCDEKSPYCQEILLADPGWSIGWFEAMIQNLKLNLTLSYIGGSTAALLDTVDHYSKQNKSTLFYRWWPDPVVTKAGGRRVAFPGE
jgi:hypothetical protein